MLGFLRAGLDKIAPHFEKGGKFATFYPVYEAIDTFLFAPGDRTKGSVHVRDGIDLKRVMIEVCLAVVPVILVSCYLVGYNALSIISQGEGVMPSDYHGFIFSLFFDPSTTKATLLPSFVYGLIYFLPLYLVVFGVGMAWEMLFASVRGHEINEGFFISTILFVLTLPPTIPLWQAALGISFGLVVGKEIFGGTGMNFMNPALVGRAFLYFSYAPQISGDKIWLAVDGYSAATPLAMAQNGESFDVWGSFVGTIPGSFGETSALVIAISGAYLIFKGIASWRTMLGGVLGLVAVAWLFHVLLDASAYPVASLSPLDHLIVGGFAFGIVYMATDPVSSPMLESSRFVYGLFIGAITVIIRVVNPGFPEGVMLAILFANILAPLIDKIFIGLHNKKRLKRYSNFSPTSSATE